MACRWIVGIVKILKNDALEPEEITNIEIFRLKFILKRQVFVLHVTSVNTGSAQVTHGAVGARIIHGLGIDLVRNPAIWLVESRDLVNLFAYRGRMYHSCWYSLCVSLFQILVMNSVQTNRKAHANYQIGFKTTWVTCARYEVFQAYKCSPRIFYEKCTRHISCLLVVKYGANRTISMRTASMNHAQSYDSQPQCRWISPEEFR